MADLTFTNVAAKLPVGAIVDDAANTDVKISLKALMGETSVALTDPKVGEAISKLLDGCANAQTDYNADAGNSTDLRSYPTPTAGTPVRNASTGVYSSTFTYTVSVAVPLNRDSAEALQV